MVRYTFSASAALTAPADGVGVAEGVDEEEALTDDADVVVGVLGVGVGADVDPAEWQPVRAATAMRAAIPRWCIGTFLTEMSAGEIMMLSCRRG